MDTEHPKITMQVSSTGRSVDVLYFDVGVTWKSRLTKAEANILATELEVTEIHGPDAQVAVVMDFLYKHNRLPVREEGL